MLELLQIKPKSQSLAAAKSADSKPAVGFDTIMQDIAAQSTAQSASERTMQSANTAQSTAQNTSERASERNERAEQNRAEQNRAEQTTQEPNSAQNTNERTERGDRAEQNTNDNDANNTERAEKNRTEQNTSEQSTDKANSTEQKRAESAKSADNAKSAAPEQNTAQEDKKTIARKLPTSEILTNLKPNAAQELLAPQEHKQARVNDKQKPQNLPKHSLLESVLNASQEKQITASKSSKTKDAPISQTITIKQTVKKLTITHIQGELNGGEVFGTLFHLLKLAKQLDLSPNLSMPVREIIGAKTVGDLVKIAQKYKLNITKIEFTTQESTLDIKSAMSSKTAAPRVSQMIEQLHEHAKTQLLSELKHTDLAPKLDNNLSLASVLESIEKSIDAQPKSKANLANLLNTNDENDADIDADALDTHEIVPDEPGDILIAQEKPAKKQIIKNDKDQNEPKTPTTATTAKESAITTTAKIIKNEPTTTTQSDLATQNTAANTIIATLSSASKQKQNTAKPAEPSAPKSTLATIPAKLDGEKLLGSLLKDLSSDKDDQSPQNERQIPLQHTSKLTSEQASTEQIKTKFVKQTLPSFANELKQAAEKYRPPVSRVKINLNPVELGEIEVNISVRGKSLNIQLNSQNQLTTGLFVAHQSELRNTLVAMGFAGLDMSFGSKKEDENASKKQNRAKKNEDKKEDEQEQTPSTLVGAISVPLSNFELKA